MDTLEIYEDAIRTAATAAYNTEAGDAAVIQAQEPIMYTSPPPFSQMRLAQALMGAEEEEGYHTPV